MKSGIALVIIILILMEGAAWWVYRSVSSRNDVLVVPEKTEESSSILPTQNEPAEKGEENKTVEEKDFPRAASEKDWSIDDFPLPSTEMVNGVTERTIHMGVRKWQWDPKTIRAKKGELVRLVIHNADVEHRIIIPDFSINQEVSPDGGVVEFVADKSGSFQISCPIYSNAGRGEMQTTLVIE